ncbi:trans-sialidase, putative [Trypanosoma cruzi marinkellei]|uniref:Trans-sialidase, putative n=1 Tax=Trypanosoma cruzi marinkellei TaxID=85056 RepID=K2N262_TRYCR|nr:trans-sialidase, putative [Trypanosoma cruzi marinkellei]
MEVVVSRPTTVVKGNDIYMLLGVYVRKNGANCKVAVGVEASFELLLVKGNVSDEDGMNRILLNDTYFIPWTPDEEQLKSLTSVIGSGGAGVKMSDGTLVFPLEGKKEESGAEEAVSLILYSLKDTNNWTLSKGIFADGCSDPSIVEWKDKKLIMMTACDGGRRRVYESGDKGESWTEALGTLSRVWGNKQKGPDKGVGSGFTTAKIEDRDVMLVTLPAYSKS